MTALQILLAVQIALGLFDILFHHELTERLSWRPTAARELALHALRNALYAAVFLTLAWVEWHGPLAWVFALVLLVELAITLTDFIEEDRSRLLPPSERVTHALLALTYGAILTLLAPMLLAWAEAPFGAALVDHGLWSWFLTVAAVGVAFWSFREWRRRAWCLGRHASARGLSQPFLDTPKRLLVTGGTGLVGRRLVEALVAGGHQVTVLTRDPRKAAALARPVEIVREMAELPRHRGFDAIVHLAGEPVAQPWSRGARRRIVESRAGVLREVAAWCAAAERRPEVLVSASAIGVYGEGGEAALTERSPAGAGFASEVCQATEAAAADMAERLGLRLVTLRFGLVLAGDGGFLGRLLLPFELGLKLRFGQRPAVALLAAPGRRRAPAVLGRRPPGGERCLQRRGADTGDAGALRAEPLGGAGAPGAAGRGAGRAGPPRLRPDGARALPRQPEGIAAARRRAGLPLPLSVPGSGARRDRRRPRARPRAAPERGPGAARPPAEAGRLRGGKRAPFDPSP